MMKLLITRPQPDAQALKIFFEKEGLSADVLPLLELHPLPPKSWHPLLAECLNAQGLIFVSPHAVDYFVQGCPSLESLQSIPCYAPGHTSAMRLKDAGFQKVLYPKTTENSEGLLALEELQNVQDKTFVIIRGQSGRELIFDTLRARQAKMTYLPVYTRQRRLLSSEEIKMLDQEYDLILVSSLEALRYLTKLKKDFSKVKVTVLPGPMEDFAQKHHLPYILITSFNTLPLL